jgi:hypothetical protein
MRVRLALVMARRPVVIADTVDGRPVYDVVRNIGSLPPVTACRVWCEVDDAYAAAAAAAPSTRTRTNAERLACVLAALVDDAADATSPYALAPAFALAPARPPRPPPALSSSSSASASASSSVPPPLPPALPPPDSPAPVWVRYPQRTALDRHGRLRSGWVARVVRSCVTSGEWRLVLEFPDEYTVLALAEYLAATGTRVLDLACTCVFGRATLLDAATGAYRAPVTVLGFRRFFLGRKQCIGSSQRVSASVLGRALLFARARERVARALQAGDASVRT